MHVVLEQELGPEAAATLMELLPPVGWSDVARRSDLAQLSAELRGEMAELRTELKGEMAELRSRIDGQLTRFIAANVPLMFGTAGLVLAAAELA
ncbi:MAG: hypothetical protein M3144_07490 [Actinomycetota bacterium]|nr:hypothetical protein [Actinomycetota bacterium]